MSICNNCYNGCTETTSDQCIKYTGINVPTLGIVTGDTLSSVESAITTYLIASLNGTGIVPYIDPTSLCTLVNSYLPISGNITLIHIVDALIKSVCSLQIQVTAISDDIVILNADYTIGCLTGVTSSSDTHNIVQATITKLCSIETTLTALSLNLVTNYVSIANIDSYIASYISGSVITSSMSSKMVPYSASEYYGPLTYFDASGAGTGDWLKIYLCNGNNGTPDKRGRVAVGATSGMGGNALNSAVDPAISGNPSYTLGSIYGANTVTLTISNLPSHTHTATSVVTEGAGHTHYTSLTGSQVSLTSATPIAQAANYGGNSSYGLSGVTGVANIGLTSPTITGITVATTNVSQGGGTAHSNVQPVLSCYYIIYIP